MRLRESTFWRVTLVFVIVVETGIMWPTCLFFAFAWHKWILLIPAVTATAGLEVLRHATAGIRRGSWMS